MTPAQNKLSGLNQQQTNDQSQIQSLEAELNLLKSEQGRVHQDIPFLTKIFPAAFPYNLHRPAIVLDLSKLATKTNVLLATISNFTPGEWNGYIDDPINFTIKGPFVNDYTFLIGMYIAMDRIITIQSLQLSSGGSNASGSSGASQSSGTGANFLNYNSTNSVIMTIQAFAYSSQPTTSVPLPPSSFHPIKSTKKK